MSPDSFFPDEIFCEIIKVCSIQAFSNAMKLSKKLRGILSTKFYLVINNIQLLKILKETKISPKDIPESMYIPKNGEMKSVIKIINNCGEFVLSGKDFFIEKTKDKKFYHDSTTISYLKLIPCELNICMLDMVSQIKFCLLRFESLGEYNFRRCKTFDYHICCS